MNDALHGRWPIVFSIIFAVSICLPGCGSKPEPADTGPEVAPESGTAQLPDPNEIPLPEFSTGVCRVYGGDAAAWVLVDGHPALSAEGNRLSPPCEVTAERGSRTITLTRPGYQDAQRVVSISQQAEVEFPPLQEVTESSVSTATTPLFEWPVGKPFALSQINSPGAELDPYLSADGLSIWFAGDRGDGKAIYTATRPSVWHDFSPAEVLIISRGPELPASPSATSDGLAIYYAQPETPCIWALLRNSPLEPFGDKRRMIVDARSDARWMAAQVLPDDLRLYWTAVEHDAVKGFAVVRKSREDKVSSPIEYPLPGLVPMLSSDGLRQYQYDGKRLTRSRRASVADRFSKSELIQELKIPGFELQPNRRQFCVSEDEQWMVYSTGELNSAGLFLVRLSNRPQWGVSPTGKAIPPKPQKQVAETRPPETGPPETAPDDTPPKVDPRSLPLPFTGYATAWAQHLAGREYEQALELTNASLKDEKFADSREILQTDLNTVQTIQKFWNLVDSVLKDGKVKSVSIGGTRANLVKYENGQMTLKSGKQEITQELKKLAAFSVAALAQTSVAADDKDAFRSIAWFLYFDSDGSPAAAFNRLVPFPEQSQELTACATSHLLHQAELEFARENYPAGMVSVRAVLEAYPDSAPARRAVELQQELYRKIEWRTLGNRKWVTDNSIGQYQAEPGRVADSYLQSPRKYRNFELQFEFKTEGELGQGGVFFHYAGEGSIYKNAYKIPLAGDAGVTPDQFSTGSLFGFEEPSENAVKPVGEWNTARLIVRGGAILFILNDKTVLETYTLSDDIPEEGYVLLDGVTGGITYRKVLLTEVR